MLNYLLSPTFQFTNTAGRPLSGGAYLEVYIHGTRTKYYCASDFDGTLHPFQIPLDSLGSAVVLAEDTGSYDIYAYNRYGSLSMSRYNVKPGAGGSGMGSITSSDGSIEVTPTSTGVDLKVNGQDPSVIRATADDLDADGSFTFSALVIEGQDLSVDEHGRIRMEDGWYHYDATVKLVWESSVNDSAAVQLYTTLNSDVMDFDLSYAHDETVQLGGEMKITTGGTSFVLGVSGLPNGMVAQLVDLGIHTITGHGDAAGYEAGDGIVIDDHEISVDPTYVQEKLTAGSNIVIEGNTISATAEPQLQANWTENDSSSVQYIQNKPDLSVYATDAELTSGLATKQDTISDLATIRSGAALGATAVQPGDLATVATTGSYDDLTDKPDLSVYATDSELTAGLATKQDVISDLATIRSGAALGATATQPADLTAGLATKQDVISDLATIRSGAALGATAVQPGDLATVASTGSYDDLTDKPVIPAAQVNSDWNASSGVAEILNKPDLSVYATDSELTAGLATKQDTLTAGSNITITNNVISATAAPQEQADWAESDSSDVSYIKNKPAVKPVVAGSNITITEGNDSFTISAAAATQEQADWAESDTTAADYIKNKPNLALKEDVANKKQSIDATSTTDYASSKAVADFVNSSVATATANFLGNYDLDDLGLTYPATTSQIETALDGYTFSTTPTNNDYVYVEVQNPQTTGIDDEVQRYKFNGTGWLYEYTLNNSSFTAAEKAAIDSGITSTDVSNYNAHIADTDIHVTTSDKSTWNAKQDAISDLATIRSGAALGATAVQPGDLATVAVTGSYADLSGTPTVDQTYDPTSSNAQSGVAVASSVSGKQDIISDLATIRSGAALGATAVQPGDLAAVASTGSYTDLSDTPTVDQTYDPLSANAQSGVAVADAVSTKQDVISDLATIRSGAQAGSTAVQPGDLATVAVTGSYADLLNTPTIPAAQVNSDWGAASGVAAILNKPHIPVIGTVTL